MKQRGFSLMVVLVALLIIGFAAVALLRSSDTGTLVAGNLAFKKTALAAGDAGSEEALTWLVATAAAGIALNSDDTDNGYYASTFDACDLTGSRTAGHANDDVNWDGSNPGNDECNMAATTVAPPGVPPDYTVRFVINRYCNAAGDPNSVFAEDGTTPMVCSTAGAGASEGSTRGGPSYGSTPLSGTSQTYYRVTTRIEGPRNTVRYAQTVVVL